MPDSRRERRAAPEVRPYVITGGRTRAEGDDVRLDTLVHADGATHPALTSEQRAVLAGLAGTYLTVAEIASRIGVPLGVAQILVADLVRAGAVQVHDAAVPGMAAGAAADQEQRYLILDVLESVYDGISAL
ncbi:DUF742 domain-containing protein [Cellulomonas sp. ACRRI]|uniref:DUF742 domain-containing protein n=1 Tax=Cellulomonas sp. ACRRI TaxID=2918188 RepID=UPI001EF2433B|nr:DUF742 domain-containing protein [Cellulomonas sp. ACRRI]MCG7287223.1 DUF742 domain-containing protein [Cellulomonas sp. ACRRI]